MADSFTSALPRYMLQQQAATSQNYPVSGLRAPISMGPESEIYGAVYGNVPTGISPESIRATYQQAADTAYNRNAEQIAARAGEAGVAPGSGYETIMRGRFAANLEGQIAQAILAAQQQDIQMQNTRATGRYGAMTSPTSTTYNTQNQAGQSGGFVMNPTRSTGTPPGSTSNPNWWQTSYGAQNASGGTRQQYGAMADTSYQNNPLSYEGGSGYISDSIGGGYPYSGGGFTASISPAEASYINRAMSMY